jgi:hypothetical protein
MHFSRCSAGAKWKCRSSASEPGSRLFNFEQRRRHRFPRLQRWQILSPTGDTRRVPSVPLTARPSRPPEASAVRPPSGPSAHAGRAFEAACFQDRVNSLMPRSGAGSSRRRGRQGVVKARGRRSPAARTGDESDVARQAGYFRRTRVPLIFWVLRALRKFGTSRSMSSKYEDSAGVFCWAL